MKKVKIFSMVLVMAVMLTACFSKEKSGSSVTKAKTDKPKTVVVNPIKTPESVKQPSVEEKVATPPVAKIKEINGFVLLSSLDKDIVIGLKYATSDNFTHRIIYPNNICVLRRSTADKLVKANTGLEKLGYRIKVWDAYRPVYVQKIFWDIVKDSRFVANPKTGGSIHNRGCAVDITLVDKNGNELLMPSKFDDFTSKAYRTNSSSQGEARKNMELLTKYMVDNGFKTLDTEWWHFDDLDSKKYAIADIDLNLFIEPK